MPFAVQLFFDLESEDSIKQIWQRLAKEKICSHMITYNYLPHITIAAFESYNITKFHDKFHKFAKEASQFELKFIKIATFQKSNNVVFAEPLTNPALNNLHAGFLSEFSNYLNDINKFALPEYWQPHCTLAFDISAYKLSAAKKVCNELNLPLTVTVDRIGLIRYPEHKEVEVYCMKEVEFINECE